MLKYIAGLPISKFIISILGALYIHLVFFTSNVKLKNRRNIDGALKKNKSFIYSFWHDQLLMCPLTWDSNSEIKVLISKHRDGDIITKVISILGFGSIRGSTNKPEKNKNKGSLRALRQIIKSLNNNISIGISPDGPKGPRHRVSDGIIHIARLSEKEIIPVGIGFKKKWILNTWDRFIIPKIFNEICFVWGKPMKVSKNSRQSLKLKKELETLMNKLTTEANKNF
tara:strand:+ start:629 stop:1306 length:678 start_codon:yes stop_codon:yes gene_type:complete